MDFLTIREMRICGISIATTIVALIVAQTGGSWSLNFTRAALAGLGLVLVLFAEKLRHTP
jgi:hypothetical protein